MAPLRSSIQPLPLAIAMLLLLAVSCKKPSTLFEDIPHSISGIDFNNLIVENDSVNQLDNGNVYNGGGVAIADFNNDSLPDIYFTGNLVPNRLFLNLGGLKFTDATEAAGVEGQGKWCRGVAVVDINNDGWNDIYVSATISSSAERRRNILYINRGSGDDGIPVFADMAADYGLDDDSHTTQAAFFDYDNDGDLDAYLVVNEINERDAQYVFRPLATDGSGVSTGKLFRNDYDTTRGHPFFTDVSKVAGICTEGYGNQATILDINEDGWFDIYVSNDYLSPDLLWINNRNGTFTESLSEYFRHTSNSAMGNDAADINNDGLIDVFTLDMNPEDNFRKKMMLLPSSYQFFQNSERFGYNFQYTRNTLQVNQGRSMKENDSIGLPVFSEISYYAGVEATDWSWTTLLADFDNDGFRDIFIGNGFPRDITDRDFGMFRSRAWNTTPKMEILKQVPEVKIHNYLYRNDGDLTFTDATKQWGLPGPTFSNGAAYGDLDGDGDLDLVVSNINDPASLYVNRTREQNPESGNFLSVRLRGAEHNINGLYATVRIFYDAAGRQVWINAPYRGYLSTVAAEGLFGLGTTAKVDSATVTWPCGRSETKYDIPACSELTFDIREASGPAASGSPATAYPLFTDVTSLLGIDYVHEETDHIDFNIQKLLPHKLSEPGPMMSTGDINGDGLDDFVIGGAAGSSAAIFLQRPDGTFSRRSLLSKAEADRKAHDDSGLILFDADGDGDPDLFIASGGYENEHGSGAYADHFYLNDGKGNFTEAAAVLPRNLTSKGGVAAADYDADGDNDLLVAGRVQPWRWPLPVSSFIYRNDTSDGRIVFTDVTAETAPALVNAGMVTAALFSDFSGDGLPDLVLAGEWMSLQFLENRKGRFVNITQTTGIENHKGWWNSLAAADIDNDGDIDYIGGNLGLNSYYRASAKYPVSVYGGDFDNNGSYDAFPSLYIKSSQEDASPGEYPAFGRDDMVKQMLSLRSRFQNYKSLAGATMDELLEQEQYAGAFRLQATEFRSSVFINEGNGRFTLKALPPIAQLSPLRGIVTGDFDGDGNTDMLSATNDFGTEVLTGRYDALSGLLLLGDGKGGFFPLRISESGIYIPGNGRDVARLRGADGSLLIAASQNRGELKIFKLKTLKE